MVSVLLEADIHAFSLLHSSDQPAGSQNCMGDGMSCKELRQRSKIVKVGGTRPFRLLAQSKRKHSPLPKPSLHFPTRRVQFLQIFGTRC